MKHTQLLSAKILAVSTLFAALAATENASYAQPDLTTPKIIYTITPADVVPADGATFTIPTAQTAIIVHCSGKGKAKAEYADYNVKAQLVLMQVVTNAQGQSSEVFYSRPDADQTQFVKAGQKVELGGAGTEEASALDAPVQAGKFVIKYVMTAVFSTGEASADPSGVESHTFTVNGVQAVPGNPNPGTLNPRGGH